MKKIDFLNELVLGNIASFIAYLKACANWSGVVLPWTTIDISSRLPIHSHHLLTEFGYTDNVRGK
jgi:hypothetical protein